MLSSYICLYQREIIHRHRTRYKAVLFVLPTFIVKRLTQPHLLNMRMISYVVWDKSVIQTFISIRQKDFEFKFNLGTQQDIFYNTKRRNRICFMNTMLQIRPTEQQKEKQMYSIPQHERWGKLGHSWAPFLW